MPELGPLMRAFELQRLIENKVTEWRERSVRVAGTSVADSYQQPLHFKRHTNRRKNSAEINRIIAKYSKPNKRTDEHRFTLPKCPEEPPVRPVRQKKLYNKLKFSRSEDTLINIGVMDTPDPSAGVKQPQFNISKYNTKSCEDITAFVDLDHTMKSKNFEESSILNAKVAPNVRHTLHSAGEDMDFSELGDSGIDFRYRGHFTTSTPISNRKTCPPVDSLSVIEFDKCTKYNSVSDLDELKKGVTEDDMLSKKSVQSASTLDIRKRWKLIKPPFRKGAFDCLIRWRKKPPTDQSR